MREIFEGVPEEFVSKTVTYDQKVPITSILEEIDRFGAVVITDGSDYVGIVEQKSIARKGSLKLDDKFSSGKFAEKVPIITNATSITDAINSFYQSSSRALPYMKGNKITGVVKRESLLKAVLSLHLLASAKVSQIMSTPVIAIDSDVNLAQAQNIMSSNNISRLVVLDNGKLYGLLTSKNMVKFGARTSGSSNREFVSTKLSAIRVADVCEKSPNTFDFTATAEEAIREIVKRENSSFVVVRNGKPVGMVTVNDILEHVVKGGAEKEEKILISGLSGADEEYRDEIVESLTELAQKVEKFANVSVSYIAVNVKKVKSNSYELSARVGLEGTGPIYVYVSDHLLERTMKELEQKLYKIFKSKKEVIVTSRKEAESTYDIEDQ